jgi:hypothetical protein
MRIRSSIIFAAVFFFVISTLPLTAQRVSVGPQIGFYKARDADNASGMGGLTLRANLTDGFAIEGSINFRKERYLNGSVDVNSWPVMATGLFYLVPVVYGAVGAGWYNSNIQYHYPPGTLIAGTTVTSETHQEFGWHFGGGLDLPLGTSTRLTGDIKYVFLNYNFTNYPGSSGVNSNFYVMTVGLLFTL